MADFPMTGRPPSVMITPWHDLSLGVPIAAIASSAPASGAWPAANRAIYVPFELPAPLAVLKMFLYNGTAVSGNVDLGIYDEHGTRLLAMGSTAQAGTSALQELNVTDTVVVGPGRFYMALAMDNTTGTVFTIGTNLQHLKAWGVAQQASAFALPATATLAAVASNFLPYFGLSARTLVA